MANITSKRYRIVFSPTNKWKTRQEVIEVLSRFGDLGELVNRYDEESESLLFQKIRQSIEGVDCEKLIELRQKSAVASAAFKDLNSARILLTGDDRIILSFQSDPLQCSWTTVIEKIAKDLDYTWTEQV